MAWVLGFCSLNLKSDFHRRGAEAQRRRERGGPQRKTKANFSPVFVFPLRLCGEMPLLFSIEFLIGPAHRAAAFRGAATGADRMIQAGREWQVEQAIESLEVFAEELVEAGDRLR